MSLALGIELVNASLIMPWLTRTSIEIVLENSGIQKNRLYFYNDLQMQGIYSMNLVFGKMRRSFVFLTSSCWDQCNTWDTFR